MPKIYTKTGDKGQTSLFGGDRVSKTNLNVEAYGTVDELNAHIGLLMAYSDPEHDFLPLLEKVQEEIFVIGSHLALNDPQMATYVPALHPEIVAQIEKTIDLYTSQLPELKHFILPGGTVAVSQCHISRTVCRRAERAVVACINSEKNYTDIIVFLNRLSDFLFVLGRYIQHKSGLPEKLWKGRN